MSRWLLRNYQYEQQKHSANYEQEVERLEEELYDVLSRYPSLSHDEKTRAVENILSQEQELCEEPEVPYEPPIDDIYGLEDRVSYSQKNEMLQRSRNAILNNYWDKKRKSRWDYSSSEKSFGGFMVTNSINSSYRL